MRNRDRKIAPVKLPPTNPPWFRVRVMVRVRVGGNLPGAIFLVNRN